MLQAVSGQGSSLLCGVGPSGEPAKLSIRWWEDIAGKALNKNDR
jgi:hypothetical protein